MSKFETPAEIQYSESQDIGKPPGGVLAVLKTIKNGLKAVAAVVFLQGS